MEDFLELFSYGVIFPRLGLLTLAALTPPEFEVELCDENAGEAVDFEADAEIIGITGYIIQMQHVYAIADRFRALGKTVVMGGPLANLLPDECRLDAAAAVVAVLSARPGRVKGIFTVPFERPRPLALKRDPRFLQEKLMGRWLKF